VLFHKHVDDVVDVYLGPPLNTINQIKTRYVLLVGTPYEMGYAHGTLLKDKATAFMNELWLYLEDQVVSCGLLSSNSDQYCSFA